MVECEGLQVASELGVEEWEHCPNGGAIAVGYIPDSCAGTARALGDEGWRMAAHAHICRACLSAMRDVLEIDEATLWEE